MNYDPIVGQIVLIRERRNVTVGFPGTTDDLSGDEMQHESKFTKTFVPQFVIPCQVVSRELVTSGSHHIDLSTKRCSCLDVDCNINLLRGPLVQPENHVMRVRLLDEDVTIIEKMDAMLKQLCIRYERWQQLFSDHPDARRTTLRHLQRMAKSMCRQQKKLLWVYSSLVHEWVPCRSAKRVLEIESESKRTYERYPFAGLRLDESLWPFYPVDHETVNNYVAFSPVDFSKLSAVVLNVAASNDVDIANIIIKGYLGYCVFDRPFLERVYLAAPVPWILL